MLTLGAVLSFILRNVVPQIILSAGIPCNLSSPVGCLNAESTIAARSF